MIKKYTSPRQQKERDEKTQEARQRAYDLLVNCVDKEPDPVKVAELTKCLNLLWGAKKVGQ